MRKTHTCQPSLQEAWLDLEHAKELRTISAILDRDPRINELILQDLRAASGSNRPTGAEGMSAECVLRALMIKQMHGFSYRELRFHLADSRTFRAFCRLGVGDGAPSKSALCRNIKAVRAQTLEKINRILVQVAAEEGIENGRKVRVDTTGAECNIHHPTDSELLWDCVRVLVRLMSRAREILGADVVQFADRSRRAKRRRKQINTNKRRRGRKRAYRDLLSVAAETHRYGVDVREVLGSHHQAGIMEGAPLNAIASELEHYLPLMEQVMEQTRRRVLAGERVPTADKIVSIFEPHTDILVKDGSGPIYGHKVCLTAGASCMVLDCVVLQGNPADSTLAVQMIDRQVQIYGKAPVQAAYDGAFASLDNLAAIKARGVQDVVFAKRRGLQVCEMARSAWVYKRLRNFRAGVEGIISFLKRVFGLSRCTWRSLPSFQSYVWSSVVACNLMVMARHLML